MSKELTVESVMKKPVITLKPTPSIMEAADLMRKENIGCIVVTENEKPVGIVTERDIVRFIAIHGKEALDSPLSSVISSPVVTCTPDTAVTKAYVIMYEKG